ncbi:MAG: hypothetical protein H8E47_01720 [Anaerolineales bacterium]|nr:hypothetical protein [Anaerolineales bacterium]
MILPQNEGCGHCSRTDVHFRPAQARTRPDEITIFKSVGLAIQDVATATKVYQLAKEKGVDKTLSLMQAVSERYAFRTKSLS